MIPMAATTTTTSVTSRGTRANHARVRFDPPQRQQSRRARDFSLGAVSPPPAHQRHTRLGQTRENTRNAPTAARIHAADFMRRPTLSIRYRSRTPQ